jgi:hypothetical protein
LRKEEQNGWQEPRMPISSRAKLFPFAQKCLTLKRFVLYGGRILLSDPENDKRYKAAKEAERVEQLIATGRETRMIQRTLNKK